MSESPSLNIKITADGASALHALDGLVSALERIKTVASNGFSGVTTRIAKLQQAFATAIPDSTVSSYERMAAALERISKAGVPNFHNQNNGGLPGTGGPNLPGAAGGGPNLPGARNSTTTNHDQGIVDAGEGARDAGRNADQASSGFKRLADAIRAAGDSGKKTDGLLKKLVKTIGRIALTRTIRAMLKAITKGVKTGIDNVREYSEHIGSTFHKAMDSVNDATLKMKNSIGAALAPAIQALTPYVIQLVNWFIQLLNVVNQFVSLMTGASSWTRAIDVDASSLEETKKKAKGAGKAVKNLLADWDELNIIQSQGGGSGGGSSKKDDDKYVTMFEQVDEFDQKIKDVVSWIKTNFDDILNIAKLIGAALLLWRLSSTLGGLIGTLARFVDIGAEIAISIMITTFLNKQFMKTGDVGWLLMDVLQVAIGASLASQMVSKLVGGGAMGAKAGAIAAGAVLSLSAVVDLVAVLGNTDTDALSEKNILMSVKSAAKLGVGMYFMLNKNTQSLWQRVGTALGAAALWLGLTVGVKATKGAIDTGEITADDIKAYATSFVTTAAGIGVLTHNMLGKSWGQAASTGIGTAAIVLGIEVAAVAVKNVIDTGEITWTSIREYLAGAFSFASGVGLVAKGFGAKPWTAAKAGIGVGVLAITIPLAVKTVRDVVDMGDITLESVTKYLSDNIGTFLGVGVAVGDFAHMATGSWKKAGKTGIAATALAISLPLSIKAARDFVDTEGITMDSVVKYLEENVASSFGTGASVALFAQTAKNLSWKSATGVGIGASVLTLTLPLAVKATKDLIDTDEIDVDSVMTFLGTLFPSILGTGVSVGMMAKSLGASSWKAGNLAMSSAIAVLTVPIAVKAAKDVIDTGDITIGSIAAFLAGILGVSYATGSAISAFKGIGTGFKVGKVTAGAGMIALGVGVGIVAVKEAVEAGEFTTEALKDSAISAIAVGLGAAFAAASLFPALGLGALVGIGVAGAVLTGAVIAVAFGIQTAIQSTKVDIKWGDYAATEEEVKAFVLGTMFETKGSVSLELIDATITASESAKNNIRQKAEALFTTINSIKLGVNSRDSLKDAQKQVDSLVEDLKTYSSTKVTELKTGITLVPVVTETGEDLSAKFLRDGITGWQTVTGYMEGLGKQLSDALIDGTTGELKSNWDQEYVETLLEKINGINEAILGAQMRTNARGTMMGKFEGLGDLNEDSFKDAVKYYTEYQDELRKGYRDIRMADIMNFEESAAIYDKMAEQNKDSEELYARYKGMADQYRLDAKTLWDTLDDNVEASVKAASAPGIEMFMKWFHGAVDQKELQEKMFSDYGGSFATDLFNAMFYDSEYKDMDPMQIVEELFANRLDRAGLGYIAEAAEKLGIPLMNLFGDEIKQMLFKAITDDENFDYSFTDEQLAEMFPDLSGVEIDLDIDDSALSEPMNAPDTSNLVNGINEAAVAVDTSISNIRASIQSLDGLSFNFDVNGAGGKINVNFPVTFAASGGMFTAGEMFVAREAGPEMIGRIGNRSAVANNEQIVSGIAGGVAAGQEEQNALLRRQNDILLQLLNKRVTAEAVPSSEWGRFNKQSNEMYERNTGVRG